MFFVAQFLSSFTHNPLPLSKELPVSYVFAYCLVFLCFISTALVVIAAYGQQDFSRDLPAGLHTNFCHLCIFNSTECIIIWHFGAGTVQRIGWTALELSL